MAALTTASQHFTESLPLSDREATLIAQATVELVERIETLERVLRDTLALLASRPDMVDAQTLGTLRRAIYAEDGPGVEYSRARVRAVKAGKWGGDGIADAIRDRQRAEIARGREAERRAQARKEAIVRHAAALGGRMMRSGELRWSHDQKDPKGIARYREAVRRADADMAGVTA